MVIKVVVIVLVVLLYTKGKVSLVIVEVVVKVVVG